MSLFALGQLCQERPVRKQLSTEYEGAPDAEKWIFEINALIFK